MESNLYNPAGQPKDWLITNFVARTNVFKKIFKDLLTGEMQYPEQHYLIQGQRGMGKTTLLLRLKYEIENTTELSNWLVPVFFNEETYDLTSLSNLWEKLLKYLDSLWETGGIYYSKTDEFVGKDGYERKCFELLIGILNAEKKKLVIFFDNFGQLFLDNLKEKEQHRFREILMNSNDIRIVGASAVVLQDLHDYSKPFFEFFKIINLEGLDKDETLLLISRLQENSPIKFDIEKNRAKIETLAILTGGVIRTIMLIYEVLLTDDNGTALRDLETILDRITPLYKHRIEDLPTQQRKIIDVIAKGWDAISAKEIAENIREDGKPMTTKLISAQLQQLERNNVIEKKKTNTKNHLYQLKERFFNIWYLMRNGDRFDKCRVMWLTRFLEAWYNDNNDIGGFITRHIELLNSGNYYPGSAILLAEALTNSSKVSFEIQAQLILATSSILNDEQKKLLPRVSLEKLELAKSLNQEKEYAESIKLLKSIDQNSEESNTLIYNNYIALNDINSAINSVNNANKLKPLLLGAAYLRLKDYHNAVKNLEEAFDLDLVGIDQIKAELANGIGKLYQLEFNNIKALKYYNAALDLGNSDAYQSLIDIFIKDKEFKNAERYLLKATKADIEGFEKKLIRFYIFTCEQREKASDLIKNGSEEHPEDIDYIFFKASVEFLNNRYENAEKLLSIFIKNVNNLENRRSLEGDFKSAILSLCTINILTKEKNKALSILDDMDLTNVALEYLLKSFIYTWDNQFDHAFDCINQCTDRFSNDVPSFYDLPWESLLLLLISKKQYHYSLNLFESGRLNFKEIYKPIYYALLQYLKNEYPNEHLKMGSELQQPVEDIIKRIEEMAVDYA